MLPQEKGSIINLSSVAGQKGVPGASVYVASKHAVEGLICRRRRQQQTIPKFGLKLPLP